MKSQLAAFLLCLFLKQTASMERCENADGTDGYCLPITNSRVVYHILAGKIQTVTNCTVGNVLGICNPVALFERLPQLHALGENEKDQRLPSPQIRQYVAEYVEEDRALIVQKKAEELERTLTLAEKADMKRNPHARAHKEVNREFYPTFAKGILAETAFRDFVERFEIPVAERVQRLPVTYRELGLPQVCPEVSVNCSDPQNDLYRRIDGACNNRDEVTWGMASRTFNRRYEATYSDGINQVRLDASGEFLPNVRVISEQLKAFAPTTFNNLTTVIIGFGQFMVHDVTLGLTASDSGGETSDCCATSINESFTDFCAAIQVEETDSFYHGRTTCLSVTRTAWKLPEECDLGPRQQVNRASSFIDGSPIYGYDDDLASTLRASDGGKLNETVGPDGDIFPPLTDATADCVNSADTYCLKSGDPRVTLQPLLTGSHILFTRQHNRLCDILSELNPSWDDETLYQQARKIVGAQIQHVSHNEMLPLIIGPGYMDTFNLWPLMEGYYTGYNPKTDPTTFSEYAAANFRFGHSMIPSAFNLNGTESSVNIAQVQFAAYHPGDYDAYAKGSLIQNSEECDPLFVEEMRNILYPKADDDFGGDLSATDIQRARDFGLFTYVDARNFSKLPTVTSWEEAEEAGIFRADTIEPLRQLFPEIADLDLIVGGLAEKPLPGALTGEIFAYLNADQHVVFRDGDRFWYENGAQSSSFTTEQLAEIRKTTMANLICDNSKTLDEVRPLAFLNLDCIDAECSIDNRLTPCPIIKTGSPNFQSWKQVASSSHGINPPALVPQ